MMNSLRVRKTLLAIVCFVLASLPSLFVAHIGVPMFDEPYQILNALDYRNAPFAPLSNFFGYVFGSLCGWELIKFRYLAYALHKLSILMACGYMWRRTRDYWPCVILTTCLLLLSSVVQMAPNLYGWDVWCLPFVVGSIIAAIEYFKGRRGWAVAALGVMSALSGLCRTPNFAVVPAVCALLLYPWADAMPRRSRLKQTALYLAITIGVTLAIMTLLYGSLADYLGYLRANPVANHDLKEILFSLVFSALDILKYMALFWCSYQALKVAFTKSRRLVWTTAVAVTAVLCYLCKSTHIDGTCFANVHEYVIGLELILLLAIWHYDGPRSLKYVIAIFILGCTPFVGSNNGILKFVTLPMLPILYVFLHRRLTKPMRAFGAAYFATVMIYACYAVRITSFQDVGTLRAQYEFSDGLAKGMKTSPERGRAVEAVMSDIEPYRRGGYQIIVLRYDAEYLYEYLLQLRNGYLRHSFNGADDNDAAYVAWTEGEIADGCDKVAVLRFGNCTEPSRMTDALDKLCTKVKATDYYTIYLKNTDSNE